MEWCVRIRPKWRHFPINSSSLRPLSYSNLDSWMTLVLQSRLTSHVVVLSSLTHKGNFSIVLPRKSKFLSNKIKDRDERQDVWANHWRWLSSGRPRSVRGCRIPNQVAGSAFGAGEHRLEAAGKMEISQIVSTGAIEVLQWGPEKPMPERWWKGNKKGGRFSTVYSSPDNAPWGMWIGAWKNPFTNLGLVWDEKNMILCEKRSNTVFCQRSDRGPMSRRQRFHYGRK
jgi:hypothetical protein